jgi:ABC-type uncharacterized transport system YnjBCD substrate-binding protein
MNHIGMPRASSAVAAATLLLALLIAPSAFAADPDPKNWKDVLAKAKGQTVAFNAWGGEPRINAYIAWAAAEMEKRGLAGVVRFPPSAVCRHPLIEGIERLFGDMQGKK